MNGFTLIIPGKPAGKGRPKFGNGRAYTPHKTVLAEDAIRAEWKDAGEPRLPEGPITLRVVLGLERPLSHYRRDGNLNTEGIRNPAPARQKPDVDNALKLIMDALNTRAWRDDVQVTDAHVIRVWTERAFTKVDASIVGQVLELGKAA